MAARRAQPFGFSLEESLAAEAASVRLYDLHFDADAICRAYDALAPIAGRLGVPAPRPRLAGGHGFDMERPGCRGAP